MRITSANATPHSQNGNYFPAYAAAQSVLPYSSTPLRQEPRHCQSKIAGLSYSTEDRELGHPELTPLGECNGAVELKSVP